MIINSFSEEFDKATNHLLELANKFFHDKMIYLGKTSKNAFSILKLKENNVNCGLIEGMTIHLNESICQFVINSKNPVLINNIKIDERAKRISVVSEANISSYIGVPIILKNGEVFGTLCAIDSKTSNFNEDEVKTLENLAYFFSFVVDLGNLALTDMLTGLYNRNFFHSLTLEKLQQQGIFMMLDLDGFKEVNDQLGHVAGDRVIKDVANRIKAHITENDYAIRWGGDEFIIIYPGLYSVDAIVQKVEMIFHEIITIPAITNNLSISTSIGIVRYPQDGKDIETLLRHADIALYQAKGNGKKNYQFYVK
jgi:diguanylate cyclase